MLDACANAIDEFNAIADKYGKPIVVASEHMWANHREQALINYTLGGRNAVCYRMPGDAARALDALAKYGEYVQGHESP
jgi:hypothetical protein